jgi:ribonuclease HI
MENRGAKSMSDKGVFTIHTDGAARGNPGPAAFAYVIEWNGAPPVEEKGTLGRATNNVAEYTALVRALEHAVRLGGRRVIVQSDSELLVKQMKGEYQVKSADLRPLHQQAQILVRRFDAVTFQHVRREQNSRADRLCNEALDGVAQRTSAAPGRSKTPPGSVSREDCVREEAVICLKAAAGEWARGNPDVPPPAQVWDQLWSILEEAGVLRSGRSR